MISPEALEKARSLVANYGSDPDGLLVGAIAAALQAAHDAAAPKLPDDLAGLVEQLEKRVLALRCVLKQTATTKYDADLSERAAAAIQSLVARNAEPPVPSSTSGRGEISDLIEKLRLACDDPMWADHVEMPKKLLRHSVDYLSALKKQVEELTAERDDARRYAVEARLRENQAEDRRVSESFARTKAEAEVAALRKALEPFVALADKRDAHYRRRGGNCDKFPDAHPSYDIDAGKRELPMGVWRAARAALTSTKETGE